MLWNGNELGRTKEMIISRSPSHGHFRINNEQPENVEYFM
jgi:hypothetical protein